MSKKYRELQQICKVINHDDLNSSVSYCWRDDLVNRHESLWSLLHKFALLNVVGASDVRAVFGNVKTNDNNSFWRWNNRADLRYLGGLDTAKLKSILNISEWNVNDSAVSTYLKPEELQSLSSKMLRFCSMCLKEGFHSPFHQMLFFTKCPIHQIELKTKCLKCSYETPYRLDKTPLLKPFGCPNCETLFCPRLLKPDYKLSLLKDNERRLDSTYAWLRKRFETEVMEAVVIADSQFLTVEKKSRNTIPNLINIWIEAFGTSGKLKHVLGKSSNLIPSNRIHIKVNFSSSREQPGINKLNDKEWESELDCIFKSISRYLVANRLAAHTKCLETIKRNLLPHEIEALLHSDKLCVTAGAYVLWRMFYEGVDSVSQLFRKPINRFRHWRSCQDINWQLLNDKYPKSKLKRIFALECLWTFYECVLLAEKLSFLKINPFNPCLVKGSLIPHWIIIPHDTKPHSSNYFQMHYWIEKSNLQKVTSMGDFKKCY